MAYHVITMLKSSEDYLNRLQENLNKYEVEGYKPEFIFEDTNSQGEQALITVLHKD